MCELLGYHRIYELTKLITTQQMNQRILCMLLSLSSLAVQAQDDVTKYYLSDYGFDTGYNYKSGAKDNVVKEINEIVGWTPSLSADYTITGIYEFGFKGKYNGTVVPETGFDGEAGGGLALSTGWEQTFCYSQEVTLPKGTYTIVAPTYNGKSVTAGQSQLAWVPNSGTEVTSTLKSYPSKKWTEDKVTFTLSTKTTGRIRIGYKAGAGSSTNSAGILIDYVKLLGENLGVTKIAIRLAVNEAKKELKNGTVGVDELQAAIDHANEQYEKGASLTTLEILEEVYQLNQAVEDFKVKNASTDKPLDRTVLINNPSFETNGTEGWELDNMASQSNTVFNLKQGSNYVESWVSMGSHIGSASVKQTLKHLPVGNYRLSANALHVQQRSAGSIFNDSDNPQTGVYIVAGNAHTLVSESKNYSVDFSVFDEGEEVEIGLEADKATGNYICVDNFTLGYTGSVNQQSYVDELQRLVARATDFIGAGIQTSVRESVDQAIATAHVALEGTGTDAQGNKLYSQEALEAARSAMLAALDACRASRARYNSLQSSIDKATKVYGWWQDDQRKATAVAALQTAIQTATAQISNADLTDQDLTAAVTALDKKTDAVDKKIYCSGNACGTDSDLKNPNSQWCYARSMESKHWVLFWEAGYGKSAPSSVESILNTADRIFEFYADSLKFINIGQGKSKTDTYKMIIRLRYTSEWEASGSGIDNTIGLLTLSRWAYTSRSGQTVAHEIGHCFQYQTHCDNNNWNGWMYTWANSGNGNVFWEMCAQWQAYKFYPSMQFNNEWLNNTLNGLHKNPLAEELRYNNYFIQDFFCHKQGKNIIARLWNESYNPEDPFQTYMRITMDSKMTSAQKLEQFNNEMWEYGARMTTFDIDDIRTAGAGTINKRAQTKLVKNSEGFWQSQASDCVENFGNNAIRLNVPANGGTVYAEFSGEAGRDGFIKYNVNKAGWKIGFVALKRDGTRVYGDVSTATYASPNATLSFDCPSGCTYLWLVVSGAPTSYWSRGWNGTTSDDEQWPYKVRFFQTNVYGNSNVNDTPSAIETVKSASSVAPAVEGIYNLSGQKVADDASALSTLPHGIYVVNGRKVVK